MFYLTTFWNISLSFGDASKIKGKESIFYASVIIIQQAYFYEN